MGRVVGRDLAEYAKAEVTIADANLEAAERIAAWIGEGRVEVRRVDVYDDQALDAVLAGADCVVNAVNYYHNLQVMAGCLRAKVPYLDLGGLFHMTRRQLELGAAFREAGVTAVLGMGACPGVTNVQASYAARGLQTVESIRIYDGGIPLEGEGIHWGYSLATILDEITMNPVTFRNGELVELAPLAEPEPYPFSPPIGVQTVHHSIHSEIATLPLNFADRGVREVSFKLNYFGFGPAVFQRLKSLVDLGLASTEPVSVGGLAIRPRDALMAVLSRQPAPSISPLEESAQELVTEVRGSDREGPVKVTLRTLNRGNPHWGVDAGAVVTGAPPAIVSAWIASGRLHSPGVHAPESVVEPEAFFQELARRGMETRLSIERPVGGAAAA